MEKWREGQKDPEVTGAPQEVQQSQLSEAGPEGFAETEATPCMDWT